MVTLFCEKSQEIVMFVCGGAQTQLNAYERALDWLICTRSTTMELSFVGRLRVNCHAALQTATGDGLVLAGVDSDGVRPRVWL